MISVPRHRYFCEGVIVQGVECPVRRRGQVCHKAHTLCEVNPGKCTREQCRCRDRVYPFTCNNIHIGETIENYALRLGFDPEEKHFDSLDGYELVTPLHECRELIKTMEEKLSKFDLHNIPNGDKGYVRRTQRAIYCLMLKEKFLNKIKEVWRKERREEHEKSERLQQMNTRVSCEKE